jgi:integrase
VAAPKRSVKGGVRVGHVQRRGKDRWRARYIDPDGRERSKTFQRKVDAERFLAAVETDKLRGSYVDPRRGRVTFGSYAKEWLGAQPVRPSSRRTYDAYLRNWLLPAFGSRALADVRPTEVRAFVRRLGEQLSERTAFHVHGLLVNIYKAAVEDGYVARSPCERTSPPKPMRARVVPLTVEEVTALIESASERYRAVVVLGATCGLRIGEVLGLRAHRIRFLERELDVVEQLLLIPGAPPELAPPKTRHSVRTVPLPDVASMELAHHLRQFPLARPDDLVFRSRVGGPIWPNSFHGQVWRPLVRKAGLPASVRFHDLRHFYASALIRAGESVKTVQAALGHASAVETLETYAGLWPDAPERTRTAVDDLFERPETARRRPAVE